MQRISVNQARKPEAIGRQVVLQGWIRTRRDSKGGFSFLELNDGSSLGQHPGRRRRRAGQLRVGGQAAHRRLQRHRARARSRSRAARGRRPRCTPASVTVHGWADPETYPLQKKRHSLREAPRMGPPAAADQHVRRGRPGAQPHLPLDPRVLPGGGLPLHPHADHHRQRLRRGGRDVPRHRRSTWPTRPARPTARSTTPRTSSTGRRT